MNLRVTVKHPEPNSVVKYSIYEGGFVDEDSWYLTLHTGTARISIVKRHIVDREEI